MPFLLILMFFFANQSLSAACGATTRIWNSNSGNNTWSKVQNWTNNNMPDTVDENALIRAAQSVTHVNVDTSISCLEVTSGELNSENGITLTILGDYFRALYLNSVVVTSGHNFTIDMASGNQTLEVKDPLNYVTLSTDGSVTFTESFEIRNALNITGTGTQLNIQADLQLTDAITPFTIPAGITVEVQNGAKLKALGGIIVNGTLHVKAGGGVVIGDSKNLTVNAGGLIKLDGAPGNIATIEGDNSQSWDMDVAGDLYANYFRLDRVGKNKLGIDITGNVQKMDYGEFHFIEPAAYAMTWGSAATLPATMSNMSFYDDDGHGDNGSIDASSYNISDVALTNWSGLGCTSEGCAFENDTNNRINWGTQEGVKLILSTNTNTGAPSNPITAGAAAEEFAIFSFSLNQAATMTNITALTFSLEGSAGPGDVDYIQVFKDSGGNCQTQGVQIGSNLTFSGSPVATATLNISNPADLQVDSSTPDCIHVYLKTTDSAENAVTVGVSIAGTGDVTNSMSYSFSDTSGPKISGPTVTISGDPTRIWNGQQGTSFPNSNNWTNGNAPTSADNCRIGAGMSDPTLGGNRACQNLQIVTGADITWGANDFAIFGSLSVDSGAIFTSAASGTLTMSGNTTQSMELSEPFPGNLIISNTSASSIVSVNSDSYVDGNVTVTDGILSIANGQTLYVGGNITVQTGAKLDIEPGGTIIMQTNGSTITIDDGATLEVIGTSSLRSTIKGETNAINYTIAVGGGTSGILNAKYYSLDNLGATGITINAGVTIDTTNNLSEGSFSCPADGADIIRLNAEIPGDAWTGMSFSKGGCTVNTWDSIYTNITASTGPLTLTAWSGDLGGSGTENVAAGDYNISWGSQSNTIKITQQAARTNASGDQGTTQNMGRWGFQQNPGSGFSNTDITSLKVSLKGTGSSNDISAIRLYEDSDCDSAGGTLLGTSTFSGNPASTTFTGLTFTVAEDTVSPAMNCIYVEFDLNSSATDTATIGAEISSDNDIVNSLGYTIDASYAAPVDLGTLSIVGITTNWTGAVDTDWFNAGNWSSGLPTANLNCVISNTANDPIINGGSPAVCKSVNITNGVVDLDTGDTLEVYGSFTNTGTFTHDGTIKFMDNGVDATNQTIDTNSTLNTVTYDKTAGGSIAIGSASLTMSNFVIPAGQTFDFTVANGKTLTISNGGTVNSGTFLIEAGGEVQVGASQTLTLSGGTFKMNGNAESRPGASAHDAFPTAYTTSKAKISPSSGTWSFNSTSGTIYLNGFVIENLDDNGFRVGGTTILSKLDGGQFSGLSTNYASMKALQLNSTGSLVATSSNVAFNWETNAESTTPANTDAYTIVYSSGCGSQTIDFTGWYGDWYEEPATFDTSTKVDTTSCTVNLNGSASAISLISFTATPHNAAVDLEWETSLELDHDGFNVYRSDVSGENFVQINGDLIRNNLYSLSYKGKYRFIDYDVANDQSYHYYIEDVDLFGNTEMHGPRIVTPLATLSAPGATAGDVNDGGSNANDGETPVTDPGTIQNPSFRDLGDGVQILSQTSTDLRIKITPPTLTINASAWDGTYDDLSMLSYSKTLEAGKPELLRRTLLIEVQSFLTSASLNSEQSSDSVMNGHKVQPAPNWVLNGSNNLVASYSLDNAFYAINQFSPNNYITVEPNLLSVGGKKFLKIIVNPVKFNPVDQDLHLLTETILDIGLDGSSWQVVPSDNNFNVAASIIANTLRIDYSAEGVYEVTYDDLVDSNVEGPFNNVDPSNLRLYQGETEIPLEVIDNDSSLTFNSGDKIRFYTRYFGPKDDTKNQVTLSVVDINGSGNSPLRMANIDGDPSGQYLNFEDEVLYNAKAEETTDVYLSEQYGDGLDHFIWKIIRSFPGLDELIMPIDLPHLNTNSSNMVEVKVSLKAGNLGISEFDHHLGLYINDSISTNAEVYFKTKDYQTISFMVDSYHFVPGNNNIKIKTFGTNANAMGLWETIIIDKVEVDYYGMRLADSDIANISNVDKNLVVSVGNFSNSTIDVFDISGPGAVAKLSNVNISSSDGGNTYDATLFTDEGNGKNGKRYYLVGNNQYLKPVALSLTTGYDSSLLDTTNKADLLIIGAKFLTDRTESLVQQRVSQGLSVKVVTLDQIYAEFGMGATSADAIKDFINYTQGNWTPAYPKYVLFIGDGTFDPKNLLAGGNYSGDFPMRLEEGRFMDFASDNWFASSYETYIPSVAVGRIPTNDASKVEDFINKMIDYENGLKAPDTNLMKMSFIAGAETDDWDDFAERSTVLKDMNSRFSNELIDRANYGSDADLKTDILDRFNNDTPFIINYMGHGAASFWGPIFQNTDARTLSNEQLPIVLALNCENAYFYDYQRSDSYITLGEDLILNREGGAIAFIGSTTQTTPAAQMYLAHEFYRELIGETNDYYKRVTLGDILQRAKIAVGEDNYSKDVVKSMSLFGDPSMPLPASLFKKRPPPVAAAAPAESGGGGCSLGANDGTPIHWTQGVMEYLFLMLAFWGIRRTIKGILTSSHRN